MTERKHTKLIQEGRYVAADGSESLDFIIPSECLPSTRSGVGIYSEAPGLIIPSEDGIQSLPSPSIIINNQPRQLRQPSYDDVGGDGGGVKKLHEGISNEFC